MSEIFNLYAKIAEENGLISIAEEETSSQEKPKESSKLKKYKKSPHPRAGSDDISTIEALYGVKPDNTVKYEDNIMEAAHPKPVVIAPSYDRLNGLVENNIERHNIMVNIVMKPNDGNFNARKYAKKELMMELIRVANDMDNMGHDELRVIADKCVYEMSGKKKVKLAALPLIPIAVVAIVIAGIWMWSHSNDVDNGLSNNIDNAIKKLNDLKTNSWYESDVDDSVKNDSELLIKYLENLKTHIGDFDAIMSAIYKPIASDMSGTQSIANLAKDEATLKSMHPGDNNVAVKLHESIAQNGGVGVKDRIETFIASIDQLIPVLMKEIDNFNSSFYQKQHTRPSWLGNLSGWAGEALHGRWGLFINDFQSAVNALNPLKESLVEARKLATNFDAVKNKAAADLQGKVTQVKDESKLPEDDKEEEDVTIENDEEKPGNENVQEKEVDSYESLAKLIGHKPSKKELEFFRSLK